KRDEGVEPSHVNVPVLRGEAHGEDVDDGEEERQREERPPYRSEPLSQTEENRVGRSDPSPPALPLGLDLGAVLGDEPPSGFRPLALVEAREVLARQRPKGRPGELPPVSECRHRIGFYEARQSGFCCSIRSTGRAISTSRVPPAKGKAPARAGAHERRVSLRLLGLDAAAHGVGPLVLVTEATRPNERSRRPGALVIGLVALAVEPGGSVPVGHCPPRLLTSQ